MSVLIYSKPLIINCLHTALTTTLTTLNDGAAGQAGGAGEGAEVVSSDNTDDKAGQAGAQKVIVEYLDVTGTPAYEEIIPNGTTAVALSVVAAWRYNDFYVSQFGSGKQNTGVLTLRKTSSGGNRITIAAKRKRAATGQFTVPLGYEFIYRGARFQASNSSTSAPLRVSVQIEAEIDPHNDGAYLDGVFTAIDFGVGGLGSQLQLGDLPEGFGIKIPSLATIRAIGVVDSGTVELAGKIFGTLRRKPANMG